METVQAPLAKPLAYWQIPLPTIAGQLAELPLGAGHAVPATAHLFGNGLQSLLVEHVPLGVPLLFW